MIRIAFECVFVFLLPSLAYFGYVALMADPAFSGKEQAKRWADHLEQAPLVWLFALGVAFLFAALMTFATLQDEPVDKPYAPAVLKDGKIVKGESK